MPVNPAVTVRITGGVDVTIQLDVVDNAGVPLDLDSDVTSSVTLVARTGTGNAQLLFKKTGVASTVLVRGRRIFTIAAADTAIARLPFGYGRYVFNVQAVYKGAHNVVVPVSPLIVQAAVL